jgi:hypothetical protein
MIEVKGVAEDLIPAVVGAVRGVMAGGLSDDIDVDVTRGPDGRWRVLLRPRYTPTLIPHGRFDFDPFEDLAVVLSATLERAFPR